MKTIKKDSLAFKKEQFNMKSERQILASLNSPFVVQLHYAFQTPEMLYLVMEFMNGGIHS